jgi:hypothetical protein
VFFIAVASGGGNITHFGLSAEQFDGTVDFPDPNTGYAPDSAVGSITGAGGDVVYIQATGTACLAAGTDDGTFTITGGTGKFAGASGGGTYSSTANFSTGTSSETYNGTISPPGSL